MNEGGVSCALDPKGGGITGSGGVDLNTFHYVPNDVPDLRRRWRLIDVERLKCKEHGHRLSNGSLLTGFTFVAGIKLRTEISEGNDRSIIAK